MKVLIIAALLTASATAKIKKKASVDENEPQSYCTWLKCPDIPTEETKKDCVYSEGILSKEDTDDIVNWGYVKYECKPILPKRKRVK